MWCVKIKTKKRRKILRRWREERRNKAERREEVKEMNGKWKKKR